MSDANFSSPHYLPENVSLQTLDIFEEVPRDLIRAFGIVYVRKFANVVKDGSLEHLISNVKGMLSVYSLTSACFSVTLAGI